MSRTDQRHEKRGGYYWRQGVPHIATTNILQIVAKPQLVYWFGKEVYLAMVLDPSLSQKDALAAPRATSGKAKARGTLVHSVMEAYKTTGKTIDTVPELYKGYVDAFYSYVGDNKLDIIEREKTVYNKEHGYAGTLDMLTKINNGKDKWILDFKTGKDIYDEVTLQLSAYKHALGGKYRMGVVLLKEDGKYKFQEVEDEFEAFLACKKVWIWKNKEKHTKFMKGVKK